MSEKTRMIEEYLSDLVDGEEKYVRANQIANDIELSSKQIGVLLSQLSRKNDSDIKVEKWARHTSTTWKIEPC